MTDTTVALVTGSGGGIGQAICRALGAAGRRVVGVERQERADPWPTVVCDLTDLAALKPLVERIEREYGIVDLLVNNAGIYRARSWDAVGPDDFHAIFGTNVAALFFLSQAVAQRLIAAERKGAIVNLASIAGRAPAGNLVYGASKSAVIGMTNGLGKLLAPHGIRVNAVAPGIVDTAMAVEIPEATRTRHLAATPMGRMARPDEIASVVAFLASDGASYLAGATVDVNGGLY